MYLHNSYTSHALVASARTAPPQPTRRILDSMDTIYTPRTGQPVSASRVAYYGGHQMTVGCAGWGVGFGYFMGHVLGLSWVGRGCAAGFFFGGRILWKFEEREEGGIAGNKSRHGCVDLHTSP
jgi:hypothetical protein